MRTARDAVGCGAGRACGAVGNAVSSTITYVGVVLERLLPSPKTLGVTMFASAPTALMRSLNSSTSTLCASVSPTSSTNAARS